MQIGLIGHGRLGKLIYQYLSQDFKMLIYDKKDSHKNNTSLEKVTQCPIILLAVPISEVKNTLQEIIKYPLGNQFIIDTCSVKVLPLQWMEEILPPSVSILGTHPMFGPDSARDTLFGSKIVLCPRRIHTPLYQKITLYLQKHGINLIESTAHEHDQEIAETLILTHYIGRGLISMGCEQKNIDTKGYRRLLKILRTVENDSWQLFKDINKYNPYAKKVLENFNLALEKNFKQVYS